MSTNDYRERLTPSLAAWLLVPLAMVLAGASTFPLGAPAAISIGVVTAIVVAVVLVAWSPVINVTATSVHIADARIDGRYLGKVAELDAAGTRDAMGPGLRADAFVVYRPWTHSAVRVDIDDDADPTPYWLVSTRSPQRLAQALRACRAADLAQAAHSEQTGCPPSS